MMSFYRADSVPDAGWPLSRLIVPTKSEGTARGQFLQFMFLKENVPSVLVESSQANQSACQPEGRDNPPRPYMPCLAPLYLRWSSSPPLVPPAPKPHADHMPPEDSESSPSFFRKPITL